MKLGEKNATIVAQHNSLVTIANAIFGGGKGKETPENPRDKYNDITAGAVSFEDAIARINSAMVVG